jgi:flagellar hook-length control protein FliK
MALNLLDSLSPTTAAPEKNAFSAKTKGASDATSLGFGQLLGGLMNPAQLQRLANTDEATETTSDKDTLSGQKIARDATDVINPDGSPAMLALAMAPPVTTAPQPNLTALVLSPNMTAITPSQSTPDVDSLVAFAKSQGLDEDVATWLVAAGKGTAATPTNTTGLLVTLGKGTAAPQAGASAKTATGAEPPDLDAESLASAAVAISLLASPTQAATKPLTTGTPAEIAPSPVQLMPMATPAAWLTPRPAATGKAAHAAPSVPQSASDKNATHTSDLDLSLIFGNGKESVKAASTPEASFTPAAWVMAGVTGHGGQTAELLNTSSLVKSFSDDKQVDDGSAQVDALNSVNAERSPSKLSDPLGGTAATKTAEPTLTTAERSELHQAQAEKMGQAIGQRMLSEMEKGHWHLKMMLKPANLGNIEVEMRLRNGELDANFTASQAATRDLLQDGLPKLKDTLTQMGMDVANMNIGGGSSQKNGGDPTPQQTQNGIFVAKSEPQEEQSTVQNPQIASSQQDGLDVLV